ncbi:MAG: hypothetical protein RLZ98_85 [Pseudomonadota bacterium]
MRSVLDFGKIALPALVAGGLVLPSTASADKVADFYKGKTVTMYIGYSSGGGYDQYARLLAKHMGKHIPGKPEFVPRNRPGAGSIILVNELYNVLPQDGTAVATFGRAIPTEQVFKTKGVGYDSTKLNWLGSLNSEVSTCASWHTVPVNTWEDMKTRGMVVGGTGPAADTDIYPIMLNNILGTKLKLITGYPGGNDINFAIEKGELEGRCGWSWSSVVGTRPQWLKEKKVKILLQMAVDRHPDLPTVPLVMDLVKTEKEKQILKLILGGQLWGRPYAVGPKVPADRVEALRKAFMDTANDDAFKAEMKKRKFDLVVLDGETVQKAVGELFTFPPDVVDAAGNARTYRGNIQISKAVIPIETMDGKLVSVKRKGARITVAADGKERKARVSGRNTKITVAGKEAKRGDLKEGMTCKLTYQASAARELACK